MSTVTLSSRLITWDYVSLVVVMVLSSSVGVYHIFAARKSKNAREFLIISKDLGVLPLMLSMSGTFISAISILGLSAEAYAYGAQLLLISVAFILTIPFGMYLHITVFYNLGSNTIFEYLEFRFNRFIRLCASALQILQTVLQAAIVIYAPALVLSQVAGLHLWTCVGSIGIVCIIYTSLGGIKAVVWNDACQVSIILVVLILVVTTGVRDAGGLSEVWKIASEGQRTQFHFLSYSKYSPYTVWTMTIAMASNGLSVLSTSQMMVQRCLSNTTLAKARLSYAGGSICTALLGFLCTFIGLVFYARYHKCDPLLAGQVTSRDQILPLFAVETLSFLPGLAGIFVAAILCATLSTFSSHLNSLTALTMEDFIRPRRPGLSEYQANLLSKILALTYGIFCVGLVAVAENVSGIIKMAFIISGAIGGPIYTLFTIGMFLPWVNTIGAVVGLLSGFIFCGWLSIGGLLKSPVLPSAPFEISECNFSSLHMGSEWWNNLTTQLNETNIFQGFFSEVEERNYTSYNGIGLNPPDIFFYSPLWYTLWSLGLGLVISLVVSIMTPTDWN